VVPKGEETLTYLSVKFPLRDPAGKIYAICGISTDISDRKRAERELRNAHAQLTRSMAELQQRTQDITRLGEMGELLQSCQSQTEAYQVVARFLPQLFPLTVGALYTINSSRNLVESVTAWGGAVTGENVFAPEDCWALRRARMHAVAKIDYGQRCDHVPVDDVSGYLCIPLLAQGEALGILHLRTTADGAAAKNASLLFTDSGRRLANAVGEQIALAIANLRLRETLRQQSIRDGLTGLFNRRYLEESLEREIRRAARSQRPLAVLMIDLDHFKRFNDTFGHDAGDALLRELGSLLQSQVRGSDIACRYGGEEFAVILPDAPLAAAQDRADVIRKSAKHIDLKHHGQALGAITLSIGVSVFPDHGDAPFSLLRAADQALYRAKAAGRDRVVLAETPAPTTPSPS
jgi:diguanylate cyclase (GGDEF)-like protein